MLKEISIENYKSLKNTKVEFKEGLNIIIGKNGSGKSNLLEFIDSSIFSEKLPELMKKYVLADDFSYTVVEKDKILTKITIKTKSISQTANTINGHISKNNLSAKTLFIESTNTDDKLLNSEYTIEDNDLSSVPKWIRFNLTRIIGYEQLIKYKLPDFAGIINSSVKYIIYPASFLKIESDDNYFILSIRFRNFFDNDFALNYKDDLENLDSIKIFLFKSFNDFLLEYNIENNLSLFSPIVEVRLSPNANLYKIDENILIDNLYLEYKINDSWIPWSYLSDGTKRLFYIIAEMSSQDDGLVLIEEPELGIHPHQLFLLMNFLKEQSRDKQIIISTHSPIVLDILGPDELDRITVAKMEKGSSRFYKLDDDQMNTAREYMQDVSDLSYYWLHSDLEGND